MSAAAAAALARLRGLADPARAAEMAAYHKVQRVYLGVPVPEVETALADWRRAPVAERVALARALWASDVHEARIGAAKLLTQARIREDEPLVWTELRAWVADFDGWAVADHACKAIERRLVAVPERLDEVEGWTRGEGVWVRRAALVATLPWSKLTHPSREDLAARERILGWAEDYVPDRDWFIQKAIGWWLRSLGAHDAERVRRFLDGPGQGLKAFARREALRRIGR